jgi:hypothetical protein
MENKENKYIISEESAKKQIDELLSYYDKEIDDSSLYMLLTYEELVRWVRKGKIEIEVSNDSLIVKQTLSRPPKILGGNMLSYREIRGIDKVMVGKNSNPNNSVERQFTLLAALSAQDIKVFHEMRAGDVSVAETIGSFFLLL